jgi:TolB-like protein/DNA-binding winged helix-turn-helix (wHTH) protein
MTTFSKADRLVGKEQPFQVGDWYVDPETDRILRGNQVIRLEPKVMEVLVFLASYPGQVITREELETSVWAGTVVGYDSLTSAMLKLRKAFDDNPKNPQIIETIPKKGYRLVASVQPAKADLDPVTPGCAESKNRKLTLSPIKSIALALFTLAMVVGGVMVFLYQPAKNTMAPTQESSYQASIAILPFDNLGGDPEQEYFVDGITDDLITDLTRLSSLFVISRDSTFAYKGIAIDINQIATDLKVRYILHGSVRRDNEQVRINALLTDTSTGNNIWAERYDGNIKHLFSLQDQITRKIVSALALKLTPAERQNLIQTDTKNIAAYEYFLHGIERFFLYSRSGNQEARKFFEKAIELDPDFARAHAILAWTYTFDFMNGWSDTPESSLKTGEQLATKALGLKENLPVAYFVRGLVYRERGEYIKALADAEQAVSLDPSYANGHVLHATLLYYAGRPQEGLEKIKMAIRLNPHHPFNYPFHLGQAYFVLERYPEAIEAFNDGLKQNPSSERLHVWLAATYAQSGQMDEARWQMEQIRLVNPVISLKRQQQAFPFKDPADLARFTDGLKKAGLSD